MYAASESWQPPPAVDGSAARHAAGSRATAWRQHHTAPVGGQMQLFGTAAWQGASTALALPPPQQRVPPWGWQLWALAGSRGSMPHSRHPAGRAASAGMLQCAQLSGAPLQARGFATAWQKGRAQAAANRRNRDALPEPPRKLRINSQIDGPHVRLVFPDNTHKVGTRKYRNLLLPMNSCMGLLLIGQIRTARVPGPPGRHRLRPHHLHAAPRMYYDFQQNDIVHGSNSTTMVILCRSAARRTSCVRITRTKRT